MWGMRRLDLSGRPSGRVDLSKWYSQALAAQERSGLAMAEYARQLGVTATTLYQWRRRLSAGGGRRSAGKATETARPRLVELVVERGDAAAAGGAGICAVVRLGDSRSIEVPRGFDADDLGRLVRVLESC